MWKQKSCLSHDFINENKFKFNNGEMIISKKIAYFEIGLGIYIIVFTFIIFYINLHFKGGFEWLFFYVLFLASGYALQAHGLYILMKLENK